MSPRHASVPESRKFSKTDGNMAKNMEAHRGSHLPKSGSPSIKRVDKKCHLKKYPWVHTQTKKKKKNLKRGAKALHYSRMSMMYKEK